MSVERNKVYRQSYRVADDSLDRYELYVGEDQMPDFDASDQPVATSSSLPISYAPDPADSGQTKVLYCVTRKRSKYNLLSHNQHPTLIEIDDLGEEQLGPITDPEILNVIDSTTGAVIINAQYPRDVDQNEADTWDIYAKLGADPDPDLDTPVETFAMGTPGVAFMMTKKITGLTAGSTYHFVVVARRQEESGDGEYGESAVVQHTLAVTYDVDGGETTAFSGN
jgi:hypothetical protein